MHVLTDKELYEAIEHARNIDEENGQYVYGIKFRYSLCISAVNIQTPS